MATIETVSPLRTRVEEGGTPVLGRWGINSEYGVLRDVLLGSADSFAWLGEENAQFSALVRDSLRRGYRFDRDLALRQYEEVVDAFRQAGAAIHYLEPRDELPYGVFSRDSSFMTPFGAVICQLANPRRRGEYATSLRFYLEHEIPVFELVSAGNFEGGDFNLIEPGCVLIGYTGLRSEEVGALQVGGWMEREGYEVKYAPIDEFFVHVDLMVCMLAEKLAAVCLDSTDPEIVDWLRARRIEIVPVAFQDTMAGGCCVVALGNDRALVPAQTGDLAARLRALGLEVYEPEISMFLRAGGGLHCLCQALRRDPV